MRERLPHAATVLRALLAACAGVAGSYAVAGFTPAFLPAPVAGFMSKTLPGSVITFAILTLGSLGQKLNLLSAIGIVVGLLGLAALAGIEAERRTGVPLAGAVLTAVLAWFLGIALTGAPVAALGAAGGAGTAMLGSHLAGRLGGDRESISPGRRRVLGSVAGFLGIGVVGVLADRRRQDDPDPPELGALSGDGAGPDSGGAATSGAGGGDAAPTERHSPTEYIRTPVPGTPGESGAATPAPTRTEAGATQTARTTETPTPAQERGIDDLLAEAREKSLGVDGLEGLVSEEFYEVDINAVNPTVDVEDWQLSVTGAVETEATYTYEDLTGMPAENRFVTLRCVGESLNGKKMDTALWTGVPVDLLLEESGPSTDCECVMLRAADDYYEEFPLEALRGGLLAYGMNGETLPRRHGYPVRALVPGHWGEINVKWLTEIEFLEAEAEGYWEKRGWHGTGPVHTVAKLHQVNHLDDGRIQVAGHAYAGTRGIQTVEVSVGGGVGWDEARLSDPHPGDDVWRQWAHTYEPPSGEHEVVVRAVDGTGTVQAKTESRPFPNGATGWVSETVDP